VLITLLGGEGKPVKYNFSELAGHLKWTGNAVGEQRKLRDEW
jgi:hypothetical protein